MDSNCDPIPGYDPLIIDRNYIPDRNPDLILGSDGFLHVLGVFNSASVEHGPDIDDVYYCRLSTEGEVIVSYENVLLEPQNYSFGDIELIQDAEGYLQFVWHSLTNINWYRFDTMGSFDNYQLFTPSSPFLSFFPIPEEPYDLLIRFVGTVDTTIFSFIYPDGTLVDHAYIPYPEETIGHFNINGGWASDCIDADNNIHTTFYRMPGDVWDNSEQIYYYLKIPYVI